ncbi:MAG: SIR2 family protein [Saprospiraceae bacterium]|nr:SIR2 family protein [Saprospiraceae bacterium]
MPYKTNCLMNWSEITDAIRCDECVLLLGPHAATYDGESLRTLLAERIHRLLRQRRPDAPADGTDLSAAVRDFLKSFPENGEALHALRQAMSDFYREFDNEPIPVYEAVARLPFKYIINTAPDDLLVKTLRTRHKTPLFFDFHFDNPEYNLVQNRQALNLETEIAEDAPLVFNLLGHYERPDSLVLTDAAKLRFLEIVLQHEKEATLPANIAFFFNKRPVRRHRKAFVFLGFDFNEWHMRLFMHLLGSRHGQVLPQSITLQGEDALQGDVQRFFTDNFNMHFAGPDALGFLTRLGQELETPAPAAPPASRELLLLYHPADEALRVELEKHLALLRREQLVAVWHEEKVMPGEDVTASLHAHLQSAQLIVPLVTANFLADDRMFTEILPGALERHRAESAVVAPVLMTPCLVEDTPLFNLLTLQPKPRGKALSQKPDREQALTAIVSELRLMLEKLNHKPVPNAAV